ncbi:metal-binding protein ZinT, partial [Sulfitobacter sp. M22298]
MPQTSASPLFFLTLSAGLALSAPVVAETKEASHDHDHSHAHDHAHDQNDIYKGYFDDAQIKDRPLSDWAG